MTGCQYVRSLTGTRIYRCATEPVGEYALHLGEGEGLLVDVCRFHADVLAARPGGHADAAAISIAADEIIHVAQAWPVAKQP
jgi:hypothetical protein